MIFVTGARGATGELAVEEALARGYAVKAVTRRPPFRLADRIQFRLSDLIHLARLRPFLAGLEGIIHLAASRTDTLKKDVMEDLGILAELLEHWRAGNFVFASSQIVYAEASAGTLLAESSPCDPYNWYAAGKLMAEQMIAAHHAVASRAGRMRGRFVVLRVPVVFFEQRARSPQILDAYCDAARRGRAFYFECPEEEARQVGTTWVSGTDLARFLVHSLEMPEGGTFNVGSGFVRWADLVERLIRHFGGKARLLFGTARGDVRLPHHDRLLDTSRWRDAGPAPHDALEDVLSRYLAANDGHLPVPRG